MRTIKRLRGSNPLGTFLNEHAIYATVGSVKSPVRIYPQGAAQAATEDYNDKGDRMKKAVMIVLMMMFVVSAAQAATTKDTVKSASQKVGNFWAREGERSGLKESTSNWGNFWANANPVNFFKNQQDSYNARKGGAVK